MLHINTFLQNIKVSMLQCIADAQIKAPKYQSFLVKVKAAKEQKSMTSQGKLVVSFIGRTCAKNIRPVCFSPMFSQ